MTTRIELELSHETAPGNSAANAVSGSLRIDGGSATTFVGWIQLLSLLEQVVQPLPGSRPDQSTSTESFRGRS